MSSRLRWAFAAFLTVGLVAAYVAWKNRSPAEPVGASRATALTTLPGPELYPSLSPDGNYVAFTWTGPKQDNTDIYVQQIGVGAPLRLTSDVASDYNPVWSPDGRWIAFLRGRPATPLARSDRELRLIPPLGGPERKLTDVSVQEMTVNPVYRSLRFSPIRTRFSLRMASRCCFSAEQPGQAANCTCFPCART